MRARAVTSTGAGQAPSDRSGYRVILRSLAECEHGLVLDEFECSSKALHARLARCLFALRNALAQWVEVAAVTSGFGAGEPSSYSATSQGTHELGAAQIVWQCRCNFG